MEKLTIAKLREVKEKLIKADRKVPRIVIGGEKYVFLRSIKWQRN